MTAPEQMDSYTEPALASFHIHNAAREAGLPMTWLDDGKASAWPELERFARLVLRAHAGVTSVARTWQHQCPRRPATAPETVLPAGDDCPKCAASGVPEVYGDWMIDRSTGRPILTYKKCSVIEAEQAEFVMRLVTASGAASVAPHYFCNKCGYSGPVQARHQRPNGSGECGYMAALVPAGVSGKCHQVNAPHTPMDSEPTK